ncbi:MAG TPA: PAS domain-containing protein [Azoarcus taiwanensis]|nr:PAS domain-containing protein [Azoarcus taiwanensis]
METKPARTCATDTETTQEHQALQALEDSETRLRLAMKATGLGLWDFRRGEEIVGSNDEVARLLGYRPEEFAETRAAFVARLHPDDRERVRRCFRDYLDGRRDDYAIEFRMRTRDGHYRWFRSVGQIVERDPGGNASRVIGTYLDIDEQVRAMARLEELSARLLSVQEDERGRLARELHDELGQRLTAIKFNVHAIGRDPQATEVSRRVADCLTLLDDTLARVRERALDLRPALLDDMGLGAALEWYCRRQEERADVCILLDGVDRLGALPDELVTTAYRLVQESVSNALRHSGCSTICVSLECQPDCLQIVVTDDGQGFDPAPDGSAGFGLMAMRERVTLVGGRFSLGSVVGQGTRITAALPIEPGMQP